MSERPPDTPSAPVPTQEGVQEDPSSTSASLHQGAPALSAEHQQQEESRSQTDRQIGALQDAAFLYAWEGTSDSGDPTPYPNQHHLQQSQQLHRAQQYYSSRQQRFAGSSQGRREQLTGQLMGMKRRAVIKQQLQQQVSEEP